MAAVLPSAVPLTEDNQTYNISDLASFDITPLSLIHELRTHSRNNVQHLLNKVFSLPLSTADHAKDTPFVVLTGKTESVLQLPRSLPLPAPEKKTRWEKYADDKGIVKKKRSRMVYDEQAKDFVPRWGADSTKKIADKHNWLIESNSTEDPFEKERLAKQLKKTKAKLREMRNVVEENGKVPVGIVKGGKRDKNELDEALRRVSGSKIKGVKSVDSKLIKNKKAKLISGGSRSEEKGNTQKLIEKIMRGEITTEKKTKKMAIKKTPKAPGRRGSRK
jgi:regulator of ribosome biosynthesis